MVSDANDKPRDETHATDAGVALVRRIEPYLQTYRLATPERQRVSLSGDLAGRRTGSSIEYQDRKDYVPGDDVRHIDWRAYARNDRLTVKLYREEITPRVDILVDVSRSMWVTDEKALRLAELAVLFQGFARRMHAQTRIEALGVTSRRLTDALDILRETPAPQGDPLPLLGALPAARTGGAKILLSDFLFPFAPNELLAALARADRVVLVQILSAFEADPGQGSEVRLEDAETDMHLDVALNRTTVEGYRRRLESLREELTRRLRLAGGAMAVVRDEDTLDDAMRALLEAGIVTV